MNICVVSTSDSYTQTFVKNHVNHLPARVFFLYGDNIAEYNYRGKHILSRSLLSKIKRRSCALFFGKHQKIYQTEALKYFFLNNKIEAVLAEFGPSGVRIMDACAAAKIPLVVQFLGYDAYHKKTLAEYGASYKELFKYAFGSIAVSYDMKEQLIRLGASSDKVHVIPCGAETGLFNDSGRNVDSPLFVSASRFIPKKGIENTLKAFKEVLKIIPEAYLTIAGDGPLLDKCVDLSSQLGISASVNFPGRITHDEYSTLLKKALVFVLHSVTDEQGDSEGTPVAVIEAQAAGVPVVATRHMGIKDVVVENETGFLVDENDHKSMAEHMVQLAHDPKLADKMGQAGKQRVLKSFSLEHSISRLWDVISKSVMESK